MLSYISDYNIGLQATPPVEEAIRLLDSNAKYITHDQMNTNEDIINFKNGILDINTMKLSPHSPKIYSTVQIPCNWTDKPCDTPQWDKYIETLTAGNAGYAKLLHEFIGAVISNVYGYRFRKALFLVGSGDTGKSVLMSWLSKILGTGNSVERSLTRIGQRFGETAAYMTRLIYSSDMSDVSADNLDRFKELTGGDSISIEYKNKEPFGYRFNGFMGFSMNKLPKFGGDKGDHVYERMLIIKCDNVIPENERDHHLPEKLYAEREALYINVFSIFAKSLKTAINSPFRRSASKR
jgi:P4 family phage/plasmid primase-like protien